MTQRKLCLYVSIHFKEQFSLFLLIFSDPPEVLLLVIKAVHVDKRVLLFVFQHMEVLQSKPSSALTTEENSYAVNQLPL